MIKASYLEVVKSITINQYYKKSVKNNLKMSETN